MNFGFSNDASGSSSNWMNFGRTPQRNLSAASPQPVAASPNGPSDPNRDDTSFAESYRPETSPLSMFLPRSDPLDSTSPNLLTSGPATAWDWQRDAAAVEPNNHQSPPLAHGARALSLDLSTELDDANAQEKPDAYGLVDTRESSPLQSAARSANEETTEAQPTGTVEPDTADAGQSGETQAHAEDLGLGVATTEEEIGITDSVPEEAAHDGAKDSQDDALATEERIPATASSESLSRASSIPNEISQPDAEPMVVDSELTASNDVQRSPGQEDNADSLVPPSTAKRARRNASDMLNEAAESVVKNIDGPRKRLSFVPFSPVVKPTASAAKKGVRKSMPARIDAETPKKRGRPRKSDAVATPATTGKSATKRGRPRKSDATPAKSPLERVQSSSSATPNKVGRPRKSAVEVVLSATPSETPKRRGRPPKDTPQPSSAKPVVKQAAATRVGRSARSTEDAVPAKRTRTVQPRVAPSPAKRGRPARKAAAPASKPAPAKPAARGRRAAAQTTSKDETAAASTADAPKRRGRPPKNATISEAKEPTAKPETKKRGRSATVKEDAPAPASKKRGRAAQAATEDVAPPATKTRGRPKRSEPTADASEPPAKKQRTTQEAKEPEAPVRRTGRGAKKDVAEETATTTAKKSTRSKPEAASVVADPPKTKTRGRGAAKPETDEPAPKPRGRAAKSGKGELPSAKDAAETEPPKRGRGRGSAPTGVVKKAAAPAAPRRALRSRG